MNTIFLSFSNSRSHPLETLKEEEGAVYSLVDRYASKHNFRVHRDSYASISAITESIIRHQSNLSLFLYSGHADRDRLLLDDQIASAKGIAALLGKCPKLKVVILNGCSSDGQVEELLKQGVPIVIATSAPINDFKATQFSIAFFQQLTEQESSIEKAYEIGLAAAQTLSLDSIQSHRGIVIPKNKTVATWGLFYKAASEKILNLRLRDRIEKVLPKASPKCFLMYDFEDREQVVKLKKFLYLFERSKKIELFDMHEYEFGENKELEIEEHLADSDFVFCLITFMFLFSTYELAERAKAMGKRIIPIQINVVGLEDTFLKNLRMLPSNRKAIAEWSNEDAAYADIVSNLRKIF